MAESCKTCRFVAAIPDVTNATGDILYHEFGECRRRCKTHSGFPTVRADDWCGEFENNKSSVVRPAISNTKKVSFILSGTTILGVVLSHYATPEKIIYKVISIGNGEFYYVDEDHVWSVDPKD